MRGEFALQLSMQYPPVIKRARHTRSGRSVRWQARRSARRAARAWWSTLEFSARRRGWALSGLVLARTRPDRKCQRREPANDSVSIASRENFLLFKLENFGTSTNLSKLLSLVRDKWIYVTWTSTLGYLTHIVRRSATHFFLRSFSFFQFTSLTINTNKFCFYSLRFLEYQ